MEYLFRLMPEIFRLATPAAYIGICIWARDVLSYGHQPELAYMCGFYIIFFSLIGHKEARFMLPIAPFLFLFAGYYLEIQARRRSLLAKVLTWVHIISEGSSFILRSSFHDRFWDAVEYIVNFSDTPPHSLYTMHRFETPYYSWLHQKGLGYDPSVNRTKVYNVQQAPSFARKAFGYPLQI